MSGISLVFFSLNLSSMPYWMSHCLLVCWVQKSEHTNPQIRLATGHQQGSVVTWRICQRIRALHPLTNHELFQDQILQDTTLCIFLCISSIIPPLHVTSHTSQLNTRSSCLNIYGTGRHADWIGLDFFLLTGCHQADKTKK